MNVTYLSTNECQIYLNKFGKSIFVELNFILNLLFYIWDIGIMIWYVRKITHYLRTEKNNQARKYSEKKVYPNQENMSNN